MLFRFTFAEVDDINTLGPDTDISEAYNARKALAAFAHITDPVRSAYLAQGYNYDAMVRDFERDAVGLIAKNPDVQFDIYFPPYSILQWVAMRDASPATLKIVYDFTAYASRRLTQFANVSLFDFRATKEVTHDLDNYGDVIHHSPAIDLKVLSWLAEGTYRVDPAAPMASLDRLKAQVEAYRPDNIATPLTVGKRIQRKIRNSLEPRIGLPHLHELYRLNSWLAAQSRSHCRIPFWSRMIADVAAGLHVKDLAVTGPAPRLLKSLLRFSG